MDYDEAVRLYVSLRDEVKVIETEADKKVATIKEKMEKLGVFIQLKAERDKLESVKTKFGTVFWTTGDRCNVVNSDEFFAFVRENEAWELVEKRASKVGVRDYINSKKAVPPGVDYSTYKQINVRKA